MNTNTDNIHFISAQTYIHITLSGVSESVVHKKTPSK